MKKKRFLGLPEIQMLSSSCKRYIHCIFTPTDYITLDALVGVFQFPFLDFSETTSFLLTYMLLVIIIIGIKPKRARRPT